MIRLIDQCGIGVTMLRHDGGELVRLLIAPIDGSDQVVVELQPDIARQLSSMLRGEQPIQVATVVPANGALPSR